MLRLVIAGAPGCGKGTQSRFICDAFGVEYISTGDVFRLNIKNQTPLGVEVESVIAAGELVSDELTNRIIKSAFDDMTGDGFLLDGYPRTAAQMNYFDAYLCAVDAKLDAVIVLDVPFDLLVERIAKRSAIEGRVDDTVDVVRKRIELYKKQMAPVLDAYKRRGLLHLVDGTGSVEHVRDVVLCTIAGLGS